jgi:hypothetical protein
VFLNESDPQKGGAAIFRASFADFAKNPHLYQTENFGPSTTLIHVENLSQLSNIQEILGKIVFLAFGIRVILYVS